MPVAAAKHPSTQQLKRLRQPKKSANTYDKWLNT